MQKKHEIKICGRCGSSFECKVGDILACQCYAVEINPQTKKFISETNYDCLCSQCMLELETLVSANPFRISPNPSHLIEQLHYYKENGYFVFTELYHYLKGTCCGNGCRHCAYGNSLNKKNKK
jgi:hypothetical protein